MSNFSGAAPAQWWVLVDSQTYGPFDLAAMAEQARQGRINPRTTIAAAGSQDWIPAASDPQLAGLFAPPPRQSGARQPPMVPQARAGAHEPVGAMQYAAPVQAARMGFGAVLFSFQGRINRGRFWLAVVLLVVIEMLAFAAIGFVFAGKLPNVQPGEPMDPALYPVFALFGLLGLVFLWPSLAIAVKRWHDRDKSGWWILIGLVPIIGGIWTLVENGFLSGTPGPNRFGPDPLGGQDV